LQISAIQVLSASTSMGVSFMVDQAQNSRSAPVSRKSLQIWQLKNPRSAMISMSYATESSS
jgi:hypothetical protein